jgi:hypothetical protein
MAPLYKAATLLTNSAPDAAASTATHPASVTIAIRPSQWDGMYGLQST